jgi:Putative MetA-pathway of phenol degradation
MKALLPILLLMGPIYCTAQDTIPELVTDRPDQTESTEVVPIRSLQIETGFLMENDKMDTLKYKSFAFNTTLLRYGLFPNMELRFGIDFREHKTRNENTDSTNSVSGFSPLYAGFKIKIREEKGWAPSIALLGALILPFTACKSYKTTNTGAEFAFSFANTFSDHFSLGYNVGIEWDGETAVPDYFYTASLGISISKKLGAFIEAYGFLPERGEQEHLADAGIDWLLLPNLQFDVSGGIGLNKAATDNFMSCGISYRVPE